MTASVVIFIPVGIATASPVTKQHRQQYEQAYHSVAKKFGRRTPGCNLFKTCHMNAKDQDVMKSLGVLKRMLTPPTVYHHSYSSSSTHSYSSSSYSGGNYTIPSSIVQCESGGNYRAVNSSSGAGGAYQIMPSTWDGYDGYPNAESAPPAVQDQKAAQIWDGGRGRSQWSC